MSTNVWTWRGKYFGYIDGDNLWSRDGRHVGKIKEDSIYNSAGKYVGEVRNENRLITSMNKRGRDGPSFTPQAKRTAVSGMDRGSFDMVVDCEDFPAL
jgi:hypothetical protein